ncbi:MAG TPA: nuclear transport factor 2 family protein [Blastocatellia bacterium]|nr:nuclear transport factor 2 family protein [Blastocatellia bacterium]
MQRLFLLLVVSLWAVLAFAQTSPRPRVVGPDVSQEKAQEQKLAATKPAPSAKTATANVRQEILRLEHEWALALLNEDAKKLETLLADNLQYTRANGKVENKAGYLKSIRDGVTKYSLVKRDDIKVQVTGDTAVVTARWKTTLQNKPNPPMTTSARYLHVYVKQNGRWLITTHQSTEIK